MSKAIVASLALLAAAVFANERPTEVEINGRVQAIVAQRDAALSDVILLNGRVAVLEDELKKLRAGCKPNP